MPATLRRTLLHDSLRASVADDTEFAPLLDTLTTLPPGTDPLAMMLQLEQRHFLADHNLNYLDKTTMAFGVLQNYSAAILSHVYGVSLIVASGGLTAYLVGSGTGMLTAGFMRDRADRMVAPALGFAAVMAAVLAWGAMPSAALWPLMVGIGFGVGFAGPGRDLLVRRAATSRFGRGSFGRIYGFVYSGLDTGQALSPLVFGPMLDAGHFRRPLIAIALFQAAALVTALRVRSTVRSEEPHGAGPLTSVPLPPAGSIE